MSNARTYTAAVIGVGKAGPPTWAKGGGHQIGYTHAEVLGRCGRTELVAAADISAANLAAFQERFPCEGFVDYREMLAKAQPDIVTIGTYLGLHAEMIEAAADSGVKGILCEKPYLASPAEIARVDACVARTGVKIQVAHIRRHRPAFMKAKELFLGGALGQPLLCCAGLEGWDLSEWGTHWIDMFRFFNDDLPVRYVMGQARVGAFRGYGHAMEEHALAVFEFANGVRGFLDGGRGLCARESDSGKPIEGAPVMTLVGSDGVLYVRNEAFLEWHGSNGPGRFEAPEHDHWLTWTQAHVAWLDGGDEPHTGHASARQTMEVIFGAYLASLHGDRIDLPLQELTHDEWPVEALARRSADRGTAL